MVFNSNRSGNGDLWRVPLAGGVAERVVATEADEGGARFDAARGRIVHQVFGADGEPVMLHSGATTLFPDPNGDAPPVWSPDGRRIAYLRAVDGVEVLHTAAADGSDARRWGTPDTADRYPAWAPDSRRIAVVRQLADGADLFILDLETGSFSRVTREAAYLGHLAWSPDGHLIAADRFEGDQTEIVTIDVATGVFTRRTSREGNDLAPSWSPDGGTIVFAGEGAARDNWDVWALDLASGTITRLTDDPAFDGGPIVVPGEMVTK